MGLDDIKDYLPVADGAVRRRLFSGLIVTLVALWAWFPDLERAGVTLGDLLGSPSVALVLLLGVYSVGTVIEVFAEYFVARAAGGAIWGLTFPVREIQFETRVVRWTLRAIAYYLVVPFYAYYAAIRGLLSDCPYREDLASLATPEARARFDALPAIVKAGFTDPFGDYFESAWQYVAQCVPVPKQRELTRLFGRNKDVLAIITSIIFVAIVLVPTFTVSEEALARLAPLLPLVLLAPLVLFYAYFRIFRAAIHNCLEVLVLYEETDNGTVAA